LGDSLANFPTLIILKHLYVLEEVPPYDCGGRSRSAKRQLKPIFFAEISANFGQK
jgi:hypothetical protein